MSKYYTNPQDRINKYLRNLFQESTNNEEKYEGAS